MAVHGKVESDLQNALNLRTIIDICIVCFLIVLVFLTEIHATCQLTDNHEVSTFDQFLFQWAFVKEAIEGSYRADIGEEAELLTHGEQTCLRTNLQCGVVVKTRISNSSEEHGISIHTRLEGLIGERVATSIDGVGAADRLLISEVVTELLCDHIQYVDSLWHDLRANTITRQYSNF